MTRAAAPNERSSLRTVLAGAIDYAGLFPPASLPLATVVENYRNYRQSEDAWSLGRLIVPAARLEEFAAVAWGARSDDDALDPEPWRISALVGDDTAAEGARVSAFNPRHGAHAVVDSVEARAATPDDVRSLAEHVRGVQLFVELPLGEQLPALLHVVREIGARAKIRTGGVVAAAIPSTHEVAHFLRACADAGVGFKATAGLHHALRGEYPLTYEPSSARGTMFGYLNVLLAAAQAREGASIEMLEATLELRQPAHLEVSDGGVRWDGATVSTSSLEATRATFALAFGSCSFREPLDELGTLFAP